MRFLLHFCVLLALAACGETTQSTQTQSQSTSSFFVTVTGLQAKNYGPASAKGAIYYFAGHNPAKPLPIQENIVPSYISSLNNGGWDVFRANTPVKYRKNEFHPLVADNINTLAREAKEKGYKRVIVVGQSFGAWAMVQASEEAQFDKFVAIAPATYGRAKSTRNPIKWRQDMLNIIPMAQKSAAPGVVFLFKEDEYYTPKVQNEVSQASYANVTVVDRPAAFTGHGSAWSDGFDFVYGKCLDSFLSSQARSFTCAKPRLSNNDPRWMRTKSQIQQGGATLVDPTTAKGLLSKNSFVGRSGSWIFNAYFATPNTLLTETRSGYYEGKKFRISYSLSDKGLCVDGKYFKKGCYDLYKWPSQENLYFIVAEDGEIVFRGQVLSGNPRNLR